MQQRDAVIVRQTILLGFSSRKQLPVFQARNPQLPTLPCILTNYIILIYKNQDKQYNVMLCILVLNILKLSEVIVLKIVLIKY
ncbi:hypothetical protein AGR56_16595 [Clostridium sp. DMHC 10]|nr:hypothetical protein AGR56_16595 [Clostridium sp. DMHC 10]